MFDIVEFVKQQERFFCEALTEPTLTWAKESQFCNSAIPEKCLSG
ncbi:DNA recombination Bet domain protein [Escherichia coli DEC8B]|nr:DNA recombination Bet domain protein [Escherichia coli DEC8B]